VSHQEEMLFTFSFKTSNWGLSELSVADH